MTPNMANIIWCQKSVGDAKALPIKDVAYITNKPVTISAAAIPSSNQSTFFQYLDLNIAATLAGLGGCCVSSV
jgi:hypothetical protein